MFPFVASAIRYHIGVAKHFFYLARCGDGSLYAGTCVNIAAREAAHNSGKGAKYTRARRPIIIIYSETYATLPEARRREVEVKRWPLETKLRLLKSASVDHRTQRKLWDAEHRKPAMLRQMDSDAASRGVIELWKWLKKNHKKRTLTGIEMGCGKGRNTLWLAEQGMGMTGFDFSPPAIAEAKKRAKAAGIAVTFRTADATKRWPFAAKSFDVGIDCFASSDIESLPGRKRARDEFRRVIRPGGYLLVYAISTRSAFHRAMQRKCPGAQPGSFHHPGGKFEKACTWSELEQMYAEFTVIKRRTLRGTSEFYGRKYKTENLWLLLKAPAS